MSNSNISKQQQRRDAQFQGRMKACLQQAYGCALAHLDVKPSGKEISDVEVENALVSRYHLTPKQASRALDGWVGCCMGSETRPTLTQLEEAVDFARRGA